VTTVSVIIPTYNRAGLVQEAIDSVLAQTLDDVEVVVVDDGSTDDTAGALRSRCYDERVRYFYQENKGRSVARNRGIMASSGRYVLFLDSDDMLLPQALEHEVAYLDAHPGIGVVYTDGYFCDVAGRDAGRIAPARPTHDPDRILEDLVVSNVILACHSALVRRAALDAVGPPYFDAALRGTEDEDLWIRLAVQGVGFAYLDAPTCKYRVHMSNASKYDPSSPAFWKRHESVKYGRFKILNADFFSRLGLDTRERFFYELLRYQLAGDEPAREQALNSARFVELPPAARARLLHALGVSHIVDEGDLALGRSRLREAVRLMPASPRHRGFLWLSYLGRPLFGGVVAARRWLGRKSRTAASSSPVGQGGLHAV